MATKAIKKTATKKPAKAAPGNKARATSAASPPVPDGVPPAFARVIAAFAEDPAVGLGRMFSSKSVLNVRGKIFAMFVRGKLVVKLPEARVDALVSGGVGDHFDTGRGRLMKEWVAVADVGVPWVPLAREAYAFVGGSGAGSAGRR